MDKLDSQAYQEASIPEKRSLLKDNEKKFVDFSGTWYFDPGRGRSSCLADAENSNL